MGNSNGTLAEYWDAIESTPGLQGGFIWEFWDHGLVQQLPDGTQRWAYGGDFGDCPERRQLLRSTGWSGPTAGRSRRCGSTGRSAAPVRIVELHDRRAGVLEIVNRQAFRDLGWLRARWELGDRRASRRRPARSTLEDLGPGGRGAAVLVGWTDPALEPGAEAWLTVRFVTAADEPWAPAGFEVAAAQLAIGSSVDGAVAAVAGAPGSAAAASDAAAVEVDADGLLVHPDLAAPADPRRCGAPRPTTTGSAGYPTRGWPWGLDRLERRLVGDRARRGDHHRPERVPDAGRASWLRHEQTFRPLTGGGIRVDEVGDRARTSWPTCPGSARSSSSGPGWSSSSGSGPARTRPTRTGAGAGSSAAGGRPSPSSTSRTSAPRRAAVTPTSAGSS